MLDENKVKLMTKISIYEKNEKYNGLVMSRYFQNDYVRFNVLKTWVAATFLFWSAVGFYVLFEFQDILGKINDIDYFGVMYKMLEWYAVFCLFYFVVASVVYNYRYWKAKKGLIEYNTNLRELIEYEGGIASKGKVVAQNESIFDIVDKEEDEDGDGVTRMLDPEVIKPKTQRVRTGASAMVQRKLAEEEEQKKQQIIANAQRLEERKKAREAEQQRAARQAEEDKRRIQERRRQLEKEQMERIRAEQNQKFVREPHMYNGDVNSQYSNGQYGNAQYANNQYQNGQYGNAQYANNQYSNGQYGNAQYVSKQYTNNQYQNGQYTNVGQKGSDR